MKKPSLYGYEKPKSIASEQYNYGRMFYSLVISNRKITKSITHDDSFYLNSFRWWWVCFHPYRSCPSATSFNTCHWYYQDLLLFQQANLLVETRLYCFVMYLAGRKVPCWFQPKEYCCKSYDDVAFDLRENASDGWGSFIQWN